MSDSLPKASGIGSLAEKSLHAALKAWYAQPGDTLEARVDGYVIDILRGEQLIEIQTRNFSAIRTKLSKLVENHPVHLVYPISREKWIVRQDETGAIKTRRKSPRRGKIESLFNELVRLPQLMPHPNFTFEVLMIQEEEVQRDDGRGSWRRGGRSIVDRRLLGVLDGHTFFTPADFRRLLPPGLPAQFTARELSRLGSLRPAIAQRMAYCLRHMGVLELIGRRGRTHLYMEVTDVQHP